jgi:heme/copper-type cytochrome/quinol oxidase subunit 2
MKIKAKPKLIFALILLLGCGASQQFLADPPGADRESVPKQSIEMTAENFHFTPEVVRVGQGTLVTLKVRAIDGTHGFKLDAFGIDESIEENKTKELEFYAGEKGEYGFQCSYFCGMGHFGMTGKVIVE